MRQHMQTIKSHILYKIGPFYMFQRQIIVLVRLKDRYRVFPYTDAFLGMAIYR